MTWDKRSRNIQGR